ncbi:3485_t:CDS:1, partial [Racocetra persica]
MCIVEFTEASSESPDEYLKVEIVDDNASYNLRSVSKKKREDSIGELNEH